MRLKTAHSAAEILRLGQVPLPEPQAGSQGEALTLAGMQSILISRLDSPEQSGAGSVTFLGANSPLRLLQSLNASFVLAEPGLIPPKAISLVWVPSIHEAISKLLMALKEEIFYPVPFPKPASGLQISSNNIMANAIVEGQLEGDVYVGPGAFIGKGSFIGKGTRIEANATVLENCIIGRNCIIQSGTVIGCGGFGFFAGKAGLAAMPHLAGVEIADECWIGANSVIAAGVLNPTSIGRECKLDSHVQIAHNVRIGSHSLIASQSGIAGSTSVGKRFQMGGAASVDGHLKIGDDVSVAACAGVTKDLADKSVVAGFPARPIGEWRRQQIGMKQLVEREQEHLPRHG